MDTLKTPDNQFDFSNMVSNKPISLNGGNHFMKYKIDDEPLYIIHSSHSSIRSSTYMLKAKCKLKQGIVKG